MTEGDDLRAYLASDVSSDEESEEDTKTKKGSKMRALLGLGSGDEEGEQVDRQVDTVLAEPGDERPLQAERLDDGIAEKEGAAFLNCLSIPPLPVIWM